MSSAIQAEKSADYCHKCQSIGCVLVDGHTVDCDSCNHERLFRCLHCEDKGWYLEERKEGEWVRPFDGKVFPVTRDYIHPCPCEQWKQNEHLVQRFMGRDIPQGMTLHQAEKHTLGKFEATTKEQRDLLAAAQRFVNEFGRDTVKGMAFFGIPGTGKTHLAQAIAQAIMERGYSVRVAPWTVIIRELKAAFDDQFMNEIDILDRLISVQLLVVDDLGIGMVDGSAEKTSWRRDVCYQLIDGRYSAGRPTIFTSNLSTADVERALGGAVWSRLHEMTTIVSEFNKLGDQRKVRK